MKECPTRQGDGVVDGDEVDKMTDEKKDKLELGDVVVLKSGGPRMTVAQKKSTGNLWWCMYFVGGDLKELKSDLCAARWKLTPRGIQIESKDDIIIS